MGDGYELKCNKCGFVHYVYNGIGFRYPMVCADILKKMKDGIYGKRFMEDTKNMPYAAVHQDCNIFICDHCGQWRNDMIIDLCVPIGEYKKREDRFCVAFDYPDDIQYVMKFDIGSEYRVIRSKQHRCGKCHHTMRPIKKNEKLKCPECGTPMVKGNTFFWD